MSRLEPVMTTLSQRWIRIVAANGDVTFLSASQFSVDYVRRHTVQSSTVDTVEGFGVRPAFGDWDVFLTQLEADEAYEFLAESRVYSSEAA
jgi:hypothetical protein